MLFRFEALGLKESQMRLLILTLFVSAIGSALPVFDQDFGCITRQEAQRYVQDFKIDIDSYGGVELCNSAIDSKKLFNDLKLIEEGQFTTSGTNRFIGDYVPQQNYFDWLKDQVRGMDRGHDIPYATAYNSWGYITMQDGWTKLSTLGRVGTLVHEARHTEGYGHTQCDQGPYQGSSVSGCDPSIDYGGSHGVEMEYYARVSVRGLNFHPAYQSMARSMLLARANWVFNEDSIGPSEVLVARAQDGLIRVKENSETQSWSWGIDHPLTYQLKRSSFGLTLLSANMEALALEISNAGIYAYADDYSYFKMLKLYPSSHLRDLEEFDFGIRRYVLGLANDQSLASFNFPQGKWGPSRPIDGLVALKTTSPLGEQGLFALYSDQTYCRLDIQSLSCQSQRMAWPSDQKSFVVFKDQVLSLGHDGIVRVNGQEEWPYTQNRSILDLVKEPTYTVFE